MCAGRVALGSRYALPPCISVRRPRARHSLGTSGGGGPPFYFWLLPSTIAHPLRIRFPLQTPTGPEWEAAKDGFKPFLEEGAKTALSAGGCCMNPFAAKTALDADWTARANTYLGTHGLAVEVCAFYTSDGKSATPHVVIQFHKVEATAPVAAPAPEPSAM